MSNAENGTPERKVRLRAEERAAYVPPPDVPCGFCGQPTYPGCRWPALPGMEVPDDVMAYVWCCDDCSAYLEQEDGRILSVKVHIDEAQA